MLIGISALNGIHFERLTSYQFVKNIRIIYNINSLNNLVTYLCSSEEMSMESSQLNETNYNKSSTALPEAFVYSADPHLVYYSSVVPRFCLEIFGIISNIINLIILNDNRMRGCFNTLLIGLTWADVFFNITTLPIDIWGILNPQNPYGNWPFSLEVYYYFVVYTLGNTSYGSSSIITSSVMVYRYIAVKFPLKANILITHKRVNITIVTAFFTCFCATLKSFVQFTVVNKTMNNKTFKDVTLSKYATPTFTQSTDNFQVIIILYLPFVISVIFAALLVVTVKRSNQSMIKETQDQQRRIKENTLTRMLVTVVFFYLVSCIFVGLRLSLRAGLMRAKYYSYGVSMTIFDCIARDILMLNSSINFILYSSTSPTFRKIFGRLFFRKSQSKQGQGLRNILQESENSLSTSIYAGESLQNVS